MSQEIEEFIAELYSIQPYSLPEKIKTPFFLRGMNLLTRHHAEKSQMYGELLSFFYTKSLESRDLESIPFLPSNIFKYLDFREDSLDSNFKYVSSSGTGASIRSRVPIDSQTSRLQTKTLSKILQDLVGQKRLPMLVIDCETNLGDRGDFNARSAAIRGMSIAASEKTFILNSEMKIDMQSLEKFANKHTGQPVLIFGFTFVIWQHFIRELIESKIQFEFKDSILIHGGGWKKLQKEIQIDKEILYRKIRETIGIERVHDYYGMAEQAGSIFIECQERFFHPSIFSEVFVRNPYSFENLGFGELGIIQVQSLLPISYPGHSLITEDLGKVIGIDNCECGRLGKYFLVEGRLANSEIKGCSDAYA